MARVARGVFKEVDSDDDDELMTSASEDDDVDVGGEDDDEIDWDVVEKIVYCCVMKDGDGMVMLMLEFCVKWEGVSYRRCSWEIEETF